MRLLEEVKLLRKNFKSLKIRQLADEYNRKYALIILPQCDEGIKVIFEYDFMILEFYGCRTVYAYEESEFSYMLNELKNLIECHTLVISVESNNKFCGAVLESCDNVCAESIFLTAERLCRNKFGKSLPKNAFVNLFYCNSELDRTEFCDFDKIFR